MEPIKSLEDFAQRAVAAQTAVDKIISEQGGEAEAPSAGATNQPVSPAPALDHFRVLSLAEQDELAACERIIERGLKTFLEVGHALIRIREGQLYRARHQTFASYLQDKWDIGVRQAQRLMSAARGDEMLREALGEGFVMPASERHHRELNLLPADKRPAAWRMALDTTPAGHTVSLEHLRQVVRAVAEDRDLDSSSEAGSQPAPPQPPTAGPVIDTEIIRTSKESRLRNRVAAALTAVRVLKEEPGFSGSPISEKILMAEHNLEDSYEQIKMVERLQESRK